MVIQRTDFEHFYALGRVCVVIERTEILTVSTLSRVWWPSKN